MTRSVARLLAAPAVAALLAPVPALNAAAAEAQAPAQTSTQTSAQTSAQDWIGTWGASPQPIWGADFLFPTGIPRELHDQTVRQVARVSLGGHRLRVVLSNAYGDRPLVIGGAGVALARTDGTVEGPSKPLTFGGQTRVTVPPGAPVVSDPVDLDVAPLGSLAVSLFFPDATPATTWHFEGTQTTVIADGDHVADPALTPSATVPSRLFLSGILVDAPAGARALVPFGDSITDGTASTRDADRRWPDVLAERLHAAGSAMSVVNEGISGARLLRDRMGDNALARFDRDVLSQPRAGTVVVMMGINDIGWPGTELTPKGEAAPGAEALTEAYRQLVFRAHARGLRVLGATLTPFEGALSGTPIHGYFDAGKEAKRQAVNEFIRHGGAFDGVIDFDAALRDPAQPPRVRAAYDSGDHLHPNDAGYRAMAESIDLGALEPPK